MARKIICEYVSGGFIAYLSLIWIEIFLLANDEDTSLNIYLSECILGRRVMGSFNGRGMIGFDRDENSAKIEYLFSKFLSSS